MDIAAGFFAVLCLLGGVLAWIDIRHGIIPNELNLTIAALGLAKAGLLGGWHAGLLAAGAGVTIGVLVWLFRRMYYVLRRVQGLGLGDVKFLAAAGTWISVFELPMLLLVASLAALVAIGVLRLTGRPMTRQSLIPFGPFLALGLLVTVALELWPR